MTIVAVLGVCVSVLFGLMYLARKKAKEDIESVSDSQEELDWYEESDEEETDEYIPERDIEDSNSLN